MWNMSRQSIMLAQEIAQVTRKQAKRSVFLPSEVCPFYLTWWCRLVTQALGWLRLENSEFQISLSYLARPHLKMTFCTHNISYPLINSLVSVFFLAARKKSFLGKNSTAPCQVFRFLKLISNRQHDFLSKKLTNSR